LNFKKAFKFTPPGCEEHFESQSSTSRADNVIMQVKKFAKTYILTLKPNDLTSKALELILDKKI